MDTLPYSPGRVRKCVHCSPEPEARHEAGRRCLLQTSGFSHLGHFLELLFMAVILLSSASPPPPPCSLDDFLEIWGRSRQGRQEWWGRGVCREEKESGWRSHPGERARMWRWKQCDKTGEQHVTDGHRLGNDGERQRDTQGDQESLAQREGKKQTGRGAPGS